MVFTSEKALHKAARDITMEFLRRNAPPPLPKGASYALKADVRISALVDEYLEIYPKVLSHLQKD